MTNLSDEELAQWSTADLVTDLRIYADLHPDTIMARQMRFAATRLRELEERIGRRDKRIEDLKIARVDADLDHKAERDKLQEENERLANHAANMLSGRAKAGAENERLRAALEKASYAVANGEFQDAWNVLEPYYSQALEAGK